VRKAEVLINGFGKNSNFPLSILVVDVSLSIMSFHFLLLCCYNNSIYLSQRLAKPKGKRLIMDSFMSETESAPLPITSQEVKLVL
jgi:hypothetical protein